MTRSRGAITGSNPFAYAVPAGRYDPLLLDMSIATVAVIPLDPVSRSNISNQMP